MTGQFCLAGSGFWRRSCRYSHRFFSAKHNYLSEEMSMNKWKHILKKIFFPPAIATIFLALFGYGFVLAVAVFDIENPVLQYLL